MRKNLPVTQQEYVLPEGTSLVSKTDLKGRITYCNPAFVETSGFDLHERAIGLGAQILAGAALRALADLASA